MQEVKKYGHYWKIRKDGYRSLLQAHGWGMRGAYASKSFGGREYMQMTFETHSTYYLCRFVPKAVFWHEISAECRAREVKTPLVQPNRDASVKSMSATERRANDAPPKIKGVQVSKSSKLALGEILELYTCRETDERRSFRRLSRRASGDWQFLVSGEWSQSPYHQGNCKFYLRSSEDRQYWALLSVGFPNRIIAVARTMQGIAVELVGARMLQASQLAGGDYIDMVDDHGEIDADSFWALYESPP